MGIIEQTPTSRVDNKGIRNILISDIISFESKMNAWNKMISGDYYDNDLVYIFSRAKDEFKKIAWELIITEVKATVYYQRMLAYETDDIWKDEISKYLLNINRNRFAKEKDVIPYLISVVIHGTDNYRKQAWDILMTYKTYLDAWDLEKLVKELNDDDDVYLKMSEQLLREKYEEIDRYYARLRNTSPYLE